MSCNTARARIRLAREELARAEKQLAGRWQCWCERFGRHRLFLLIGGGLLGGFTLVALPPRRWSRVGAALFSTGAWLARSPAAPALFAALWARIPRQPTTARPAGTGRPEVGNAASPASRSPH